MKTPALLAAGLLWATTAAAQAPGLLVDGDWLAAHLDDPGIVVIHTDSRRGAYDTGHIPGARFVATASIIVPGEPEVGYEMPSVDSLVAVLRAAGVTDDTHVIIAAGSSPLAATRLWTTFDYLGLGDRASVLDGGLRHWRAENRPLTADVPEVTEGTLTARPRTDVIVTADWVAERLDDPRIALIDARPDAEYTGEDGGMGGMTHPGHIPGAHQLYWEELVVAGSPGQIFLPEARLRERYAAAGADAADRVVTYCMVGARASLTYFVGRMLGYEMRFYDGSWHDWGTRDLPYVTGRNPR